MLKNKQNLSKKKEKVKTLEFKKFKIQGSKSKPIPKAFIKSD
jgi:hypothetical protein